MKIYDCKIEDPDEDLLFASEVKKPVTVELENNFIVEAEPLIEDAIIEIVMEEIHVPL